MTQPFDDTLRPNDLPYPWNADELQGTFDHAGTTLTDWLTAVGTVGAVIVALGTAIFLHMKDRKNSREAQEQKRWNNARLVSAWIESTYVADATKTRYKRAVTLCVANESTAPVFNVQVQAGVDRGVGIINLGPLSAPSVIPTLPPKQKLRYDITSGILSLYGLVSDTSHQLITQLIFEDHEKGIWHQDFNTPLDKLKDRPSPEPEEDKDRAETQRDYGYVIYNPYWPLNEIRKRYSGSDRNMEDFESALESMGFLLPSLLSQEYLAKVRRMLTTWRRAAYAFYPTPRVAHVHLSGVGNEEGAQAVATLVWKGNSAWQLHSVGATAPSWMIDFTDITNLGYDPLDNLYEIEKRTKQ